jgi:transposase
VEQLQDQVAELTAALEESRRKAKRQAAPFSKGPPKAHPKKPGRKPGARYGPKAHRPPPAPTQIDEVYEAPLPAACPKCGGPLHETRVAPQFQVELPRRPRYRQFNVHVGRCRACGRRVQGRHALQTSDALGAAASQLGPEAQAAISFLNKYGGLSHGKIVRVFAELFGISLSRGGSAQAVLRAGRRSQGVYDQLAASVRNSPWAVPDETGWKVGGRPAWLHVLVGAAAVCYVIAPSRGAEAAAGVLGWNYPGVLIHDGWTSYGRFRAARHQQCAGHLLRRAREMLAHAAGAAARFPRQVLSLFRQAFAFRDRYAAGNLSADDLADRYLALVVVLDELTSRPRRNAANAKLAKHLRRHRWEWFWFLLEPGLDATNWRAEQALRLGVVNRKVWGGNRTWPGARAQEVLMSVWATCQRRGLCGLDFLAALLRRSGALPLPPAPLAADS